MPGVHKGKHLVSPEVNSDLSRRCWELRLRCMTQDQIAAELGITQPRVSTILARVRDRVRIETEEQVRAYKQEQLSQLQWVASEAAAAWVASKAKEKPNPKFLTETRGALKDIRDILGIDAPIKTESLVQSNITDDDERILAQLMATLGEPAGATTPPADTRPQEPGGVRDPGQPGEVAPAAPPATPEPEAG